MVHRSYPSSSDFENLSKLKTEASSDANVWDYSNVVVQKPWGYEYLWFQNSSVAVWMLFIVSGSSTSMHCHARKRTSLIVIDGEVICSTLEDRYRCRPGDALVLEACVFHSTGAVSTGGAFVMEVETPPLKGDLLRFKDDFGRAGKGYEGVSQHSTNFEAFCYKPFHLLCQRRGEGFRLESLFLKLATIGEVDELQENLSLASLAVPFLGRLSYGKNVIADIGQVVACNDLKQIKCPPAFPPVEMLLISDSLIS